MAIAGYCECWDGSIDTGDGHCDTKYYSSVGKANTVLIGAT